ncbi:zinc finger, DHHC-type, palmitoyltransferase [Artemisia annua]|uniref:S-acyltransferase n=1 Tax=Artemisia annua TaxID=35608 RepID=A0A2U1KLU3_ARTAN|nr:zinc finger, DHHC-type, palmitoyltransferase [Artemisia annua]
MRKHGWQLPYHPLQVVAVSVFLALGFGFYVFFAPFVGKKMYQYIVMGIYTPLIISAVGLYIWCAGADPADPGVFKSKKYVKTPNNKMGSRVKESKLGGESISSVQDANAASVGGKPGIKSSKNQDSRTEDIVSESVKVVARPPWFMAVFAPCAMMCPCSSSNEESSELQMSEDGMFYCSLCEVEVFKYSKHCRVCDKCVDRFDHHCRWLNNCVGKKNYRKFFTLMISALLLLILQWSTGIVVMICCFLDHKRFSVDIATKLGSSFSLVPYVIVVAVCTILAMIATLPLVQLFFFHILLIKKGISTYDYIIALREQEQQGIGGQQSPQMSQASSITGLSSASSFNTFRQGAWCTPPRLFVEDQYDVVPTDTGSVSSLGKKTVDEPIKKKNPAAVKISPWTLARLNAEEVSKAAAEARKKSKIIQPVSRKETHQTGPYGLERDRSLGSSERRLFSRLDSNRRRGSSRIRLPEHLQPMDHPPLNHNIGYDTVTGGDFSSLMPLQLEARSVFRPMGSTGIVGSSPDSSLDSPDIHPVRISSGTDDTTRRLTGFPISGAHEKPAVMPLSRSTSDGYDASGGEDSDRVPSRLVHRSGDWSARLFGGEQDERNARFKMPSSSTSTYPNERKM